MLFLNDDLFCRGKIQTYLALSEKVIFPIVKSWINCE